MNDRIQILKKIPVKMLHPFPGHTLSDDYDEMYFKMMDGMRTCGIIEPIHVVPCQNPNDGFFIIDGHRRVRAALALGIDPVPAFINFVDMEIAAKMVHYCNIHASRTREELDAAEKMLQEAEQHIRYKQAEKDKAEWDRKRAELAGIKERDYEK